MVTEETPEKPGNRGPAAHRRAGTGLRHEGRWVIGMVEVAEDIVHYAVALLLVGVAAVVLVGSVTDFFDTGSAAPRPAVGAEPTTTVAGHPAAQSTGGRSFAERVTAVINSVLFVIIVMEILRTVVAHFDDAGLQLKPFLIIGIISAVRHILTVGARESLGATEDASHFRQAQMELGVNAAVVLALVVGLVLVWRSEQIAGEGVVETDTTVGLA